MPDGGPHFFGNLLDVCRFVPVWGSPMADQYRIRAAEFHAKAQGATDPKLRAQFENLSLAYLRLAEQADRNSQTELIYEPPPPKLDGPKS